MGGSAGRVLVRQGEVWQSGFVVARSGESDLGEIGQSRLGLVGVGWSWHGMAGQLGWVMV